MSPAKETNRRGLGIGPLSPLDWLLLAVPAAFAVRFIPAWKNDTLLFIITGVAIVPLAAWMSRATDQLGERAGPGIGGLLNATFGNAPELIIAVMALSKGLIDVVKASITGSIIGNILLVLGSAILAGGMRYPHQRYNQTAARVAATSLCLAAVGLVIPTILHLAADRQPGGEASLAEPNISLSIAAVLLATYIVWLTFSLITHKALFQAPDVDGGDAKEEAWPVAKSVLVLALATVFMAIISEFFAGSVEVACTSLGLKDVFVGVIIVALVSNAGEFSTTVAAALRNKMDLCLSVAIGSSLQIALFVTPLLIFASCLLGRPMTLQFSLPEIVAIVIAVGIIVLISGDGECNWVEGAQLLSVYLIVGIMFFFLPIKPVPRIAAPVSRSASQLHSDRAQK